MPPLPEHPTVRLPPALEAVVQAAWAADGPVRLAPWEGVDPAGLVRFLHQRACQDGYRPLARAVRPDGAGEPDGWVHVDQLGPTPPGQRAVLVGGPPIPVPPSVVAALVAADADYLVGVDPGLVDLRRSLLAYARAGRALALVGPPGSGREALVRWAWARAGGDPHPSLVVDAPPGGPEAWLLVREVEGGDEEVLRALRRRLRPDPATRPAPAGPPLARPDHPAFAALRGESPSFVRVLVDAARVARTPATVLVLGEPGTGKEGLARAIHDASGRPGPFHAVDLAAVPSELVESELFGHLRGAFTGAQGERAGAFRAAQGGTLFLDELGNLDLATQAKLLRVLQERVVRPVGSERAVPVDVRVVAATNADLDTRVAQGRFRLDLLHRLNAITLRLPPLRERPEDVVPLAVELLRGLRGDREAPVCTPEAAALLRAAPWPGNVRELIGVLSHVAAFSDPGEPVGAAHLAPVARAARRGLTVVLPADVAAAETLGVPVTLTVPGLAERGEASARHHVRAAAGGRPLDPAVVDVLARGATRPSAVRADVEALLAATEGPVDLEVLRRVLPTRLGRAPLRVGLGAEGWTQDHDAEVVVVGRARGLDEVGGADARGAARVRALRAALGSAEPAFFAVPWEPALSRAHLLLRRAGEGVEVQVLVDAAGPVSVTEWGRGPVRLGPAEVGRFGAAAQVEIELGPARRLVLLVSVDLGARTRLAAALQPDGPSVETAHEDAGARVDASRVWALDAAERAALNEVVSTFEDGDFSAHLRAGLGGRGLRRLAGYVLEVRPTQYCARLYAWPGNALLVEELVAGQRARPDLERWLDHLPGQLGTVLRPAFQPPQ